MSRSNDYGFINLDSYWDIGTEDLRGKDGDDARVAAKKYNDHRHVAKDLGNNSLAFYGFLYENKPIQNPMGLDYEINDEATVAPIRMSGDLVKYNGILWMYDDNAIAVPLGVGPGCYFKPDHESSTGRFVREAVTTQELICGREEIIRTEGILRSEGGVDIELGSAYREIGGVLLDMTMHNLHRTRSMVRFECTGSLIHEGDSPYEALKNLNNQVYSNTAFSIGTILAEFLEHSSAKAGDVKFIWDRNGDPDIDVDAIREYPFFTDANTELSPLYINDSTLGGVRVQRSNYILLNLNRTYVVRVRARLRTFDTNQEIVDDWNRFITVVNGADGHPNLPGLILPNAIGDVFGGANGGNLNADEGSNIYDKIRYWQSSHCTFEILNVKIRVDNFLGMPSEVFDTGDRRTSLIPPADASEYYIAND